MKNGGSFHSYVNVYQRVLTDESALRTAAEMLPASLTQGSFSTSALTSLEDA